MSLLFWSINILSLQFTPKFQIIINVPFRQFSIIDGRGVIGEVRCRFLWIYAPTPYSAVFLLHAPIVALAPIKIGFGALRCGLVWYGIGVVLRFRLDSFGSNWASPNVNLNLKNPLLQ